MRCLKVSNTDFIYNFLYTMSIIFFLLCQGICSILFGRRGPPTWKNCARQEKKFDISIFFYFFLRHARKTKNFFSTLACPQITWDSTIFLTKNSFPAFFEPTCACCMVGSYASLSVGLSVCHVTISLDNNSYLRNTTTETSMDTSKSSMKYLVCTCQ